ncbi:MAG: RNA methyltransferase [Rhodospirillaceae bacterium]|nr:RNA methyltransferase [Rhodospirillaceae bacterium]
MTELELRISALGSRGDGIAESSDGPVFVPYSLPGDLVTVRIEKSKSGPGRGKLLSVLESGPNRVEASCEHYTKCGGCSVQQLSLPDYYDWKREIVCDALKRQGLDRNVVHELVTGRTEERRRARFSAKKLVSGTVLGFLEARSHRIVSLSQCPVLSPSITQIMSPLRDLLGSLLSHRPSAEVAVTETDSGLDICLYMPMGPELNARMLLAEFAARHDIARISWDSFRSSSSEFSEPIVSNHMAVMEFGDIPVAVPPDAFVQPTKFGEDVLRECIITAVSDSKKIVELFAGCGSFTLPMAVEGHHISAFDYADDHMMALLAAVRSNGLADRVSVAERNLKRRPLDASEFDGVDAVVLDPPRAGAPEQIKHLAQSEVPVIAYVSCNPLSFARDARVLVEGGYRLDRVVPVDQFLWSPHVELFGVLKRA